MRSLVGHSGHPGLYGWSDLSGQVGLICLEGLVSLVTGLSDHLDSRGSGHNLPNLQFAKFSVLSVHLQTDFQSCSRHRLYVSNWMLILIISRFWM